MAKPSKTWSNLLVIDQATGEIERISLDDRNCRASVSMTAERLGMQVDDAWEILKNGGELATFGFVRQLE